ncbi:hypothetical protein [Corynebacterium callunae]|uniref:Uncharacterized protein n=1 Tax=Corynebacterium callunae DSM 20147 TaxID=1121353 RepID=M1UWJ5_9CORY|nr:hypothetical protein [Corynebacterium callunae]AGG68067.1 hypothetical protein H924_13390 [Corynebacterium callunae DSM 20147]
MTIILDCDSDIFIAETPTELAAQLISRLPHSPDDRMLADLAAAVFGCDYLDIIITRTSS